MNSWKNTVSNDDRNLKPVFWWRIATGDHNLMECTGDMSPAMGTSSR